MASLFYYSDVLKYRSSPVFYLIVFLCFWLLPGLRGQVGQDTASYSHYFNEMDDYGIGIFFVFEPVFSSIIYLSYYIYPDVNFFYLVVSLIQAVLFFLILSRLTHSFLFFLIYLFVFYLEFHFNVLRAGLASLFFLLALSYAPQKKSWIYVIIATMCHFSIFLFLPIFMFRANLKIIYSFFLAILIIFLGSAVFYVFSDMILGKIAIYWAKEYSDPGVPVIVIMMIASGLFCFLCQGRFSLTVFISFVFLSATLYLSALLPIAYRLYNISFIIFIFLALEKKEFSFSYLKFSPVSMYLIIIALWFSVSMSINVYYEKERLLSKGTGDPNFTFLPYEFFWETDSR